jgi:hypothetical protein
MQWREGGRGKEFKKVRRRRASERDVTGKWEMTGEGERIALRTKSRHGHWWAHAT